MTNWNQEGHVLATCDDRVVYCRVVGIGNMNNCAPFQHFSHLMQEKGYREFILDFSRCEGLDSTFLGTLLGVAMGRHVDRTHVVVINASASVRRILSEVGIDHLLEVRADAVQLPEVPLKRLELGEEKLHTKFSMVLEAHENLCRVAGENEKRFGTFVQLLRAEMAASREQSATANSGAKPPAAS